MIKRIIVLIIGLVIIAAGIGGFYFWYLAASLDNLAASANLIQDSLSEAVAIKGSGDMIAAKKKNLPANYTWKALYDRSVTVTGLLGGLMVPERLEEYKKISTIWAVKIREAAKDGKTWNEVPAQPGDFAISLREKEAQELVKDVMVKLAETRQFGDYAVANDDREAMRYVSAKLLVQKHWLDGITHYQPAGILAGLATPAHAYEAEGKKVCFTTWNGKPLCSIEVQEINTEMYNAANDVIEEKKGAKDAWYKVSQEVFAKLEAEGMPAETLGGVVNAEDKTANFEPILLTNFKNACLERGGIIGGANQNTSGIPSTERGTYCGYRDQANNCWNFMTNSGGYYSGGDVGCARIGLMPAELVVELGGIEPPAAEVQPEVKTAQPAPGKTTAPKPQPKPVLHTPTVPEPTEPEPIAEAPEIPAIPPSVSPDAGLNQDNTYPFDGYYYVNETYTCNLTDGSARTTNTTYSIDVKNGVATTNLDWGKNSAAISGNSAQVSGQSSDSYYRYSYTINMNFSQSPNGTWVSGTRNWSQNWIGYSTGLSGNCHGSFKGSGN